MLNEKYLSMEQLTDSQTEATIVNRNFKSFFNKRSALPYKTYSHNR
jgi:hypothetical protein